MCQFVVNSGRNENTPVQPGQDPDLLNEDQVVDWRGVRYVTMKRSGSRLTLYHPELAEGFPILFKVCGSVVVDFVLLKKGVKLHSRLEAKQPPKLRGSECARPVCFERQTLERGARQIPPPGFEPLGDVFRQFQCNLHRRASFSSLSQEARPRGRLRRTRQRLLRFDFYEEFAPASLVDTPAKGLENASCVVLELFRRGRPDLVRSRVQGLY